MDWDEIAGQKKKFFCKAIFNKNDTSDTGKDWIFAKRCNLSMYDDRLEASDYKILFKHIRSAWLRIVPSAFFFPRCILTIEADSSKHHFGLMYTSFWRSDLPFQVTRTNVNPPYLWLRRLIVLTIAVSVVFGIFK